MNVITKRAFLLAAALVAGEEGLRLVAYKDAAGIWTICNGVTQGVKEGDTATPAYCQNRLIVELNRHSKPFKKLPLQAPQHVNIAMLSWGYNVGVGNVLGSSVYDYLEVGSWNRACKGLLDWRKVRINGILRDCSMEPWKRQCGGVYNRRVDEYLVCTGTISPEAMIAKWGFLPPPDGAER